MVAVVVEKVRARMLEVASAKSFERIGGGNGSGVQDVFL